MTVPTVDRFVLEVNGEPQPSGRPRFRAAGGRVFVHPHPRDKPAKARVLAAWRQAGSPRLGPGVYRVAMTVRCARPASHWTSTGALSAAGRRSLCPGPDVDNLAKLPLDALVAAEAVPDDRYCVTLTVSKAWADERDAEGCVTVEVRAVEAAPVVA